MSLKLTVKQRHDNLIKEFLFNYKSSVPDSVTFEFLIDALFCTYYECKLPFHKDEKIVAQFIKSSMGLLISNYGY